MENYLAHMVKFQGETDIPSGRIDYILRVPCGWAPRAGDVVTSNRADVTCPGCRRAMKLPPPATDACPDSHHDLPLPLDW